MQQEIGLYSLMLFGFWHFGTKAIEVELKAGIRVLAWKKLSTSCTTSSPTTGHETLKKCEVYPSGLRDFPPSIANIDAFTYSGVTCLINSCPASFDVVSDKNSASRSFGQPVTFPSFVPIRC